MICILKRTIFYFFVSFFICFFSYSQKSNEGASGVEVRAYADRSQAAIGDRIKYSLEADVAGGVRVEFPSQLSDTGGLSLRDFGSEEERIGLNHKRYRNWYILDTYTPGSYIIPEQKIKIIFPDKHKETLPTERIFINVKSLLRGEGKDSLRDIKGPLAIDERFPLFLLIIIAVVMGVIAAVIIWVRSSMKKRGKIKPDIYISPSQIALEELSRIEKLSLIENGNIKEYYYLVSLALRGYLENKFFFRAPEQTTEEFLASALASDKLERRHINILKEYLMHCDMVKYARFAPAVDEARRLIQTTRRFISETDKNDVA